jgi:hypothetical protein
MDRNNISFIGFILIFLLLIAAALAFANTDQITPAVAQAEAEITVGANTVQVVQKSASFILKLFVGASAAGVAAAAFAEAHKAYKMWKRNSLKKRWVPGPNAQWKQPQLPKLRREDLMLLALSGKLPADNLRPNPKRGSIRVQDGEQNTDLEMPQ